MNEMSKSTSVLIALLALVVGYCIYSGTAVSALGEPGLQARMERTSAIKDTIDDLQIRIDSAKRDLAKESLDDIRKRVEAYRASLATLRALVPEGREVASLLDDISIRAKVRGLRVSAFTPIAPQPGPAPFDTYSYNFSVQGKYNRIGEFLTDIASLRRIMVPSDVKMHPADVAAARATGDTVLEASFIIRTYVKAKTAEDSAHGQ